MQRLSILLALFALLTAAAFACDVNTVVINGQRMMSLRTFGDTFGAVINYDSERDGFSISLGYRTVALVPYSQTAWIDDSAVSLGSPVVVIDDITYVPVRFLCNAFDLNCNWNNPAQPVIINNCSGDRVVLVLDLDWGRCHHVWNRDYDCHNYWNFRVDCVHYDAPRYQGWDHHSDRNGNWTQQHNSRQYQVVNHPAPRSVNVVQNNVNVQYNSYSQHIVQSPRVTDNSHYSQSRSAQISYRQQYGSSTQRTDYNHYNASNQRASLSRYTPSQSQNKQQQRGQKDGGEKQRW